MVINTNTLDSISISISLSLISSSLCLTVCSWCATKEWEEQIVGFERLEANFVIEGYLSFIYADAWVSSPLFIQKKKKKLISFGLLTLCMHTQPVT